MGLARGALLLGIALPNFRWQLQRGVAHLERGQRPAARGEEGAAILEVIQRRGTGHAERLG